MKTSTPLCHDSIWKVAEDLDLQSALRLRSTFSPHYRDGVDNLLRSLWNEIITMEPTPNFCFGDIAQKVNTELNTSVGEKNIVKYFEVFEKECSQLYRKSLFHGGTPLRIHELEEKQQRLQIADVNLQIFWSAIPMPTEDEPVRTAAEIRAWIADPTHQQQINNIREIDLRDRNLTVLPPEIGRLTHLEGLYVDHNQLPSLPGEIGQLKRLKFLYVNHNYLSSLPVEIGRLRYLKVLDVSNNQLPSLPVEIGQLTDLEVLDVDNNHLSSLPLEIGKLIRLRVLHAFNNPLGLLVKFKVLFRLFF